jgi:small subunit ribosomal protein S4
MVKKKGRLMRRFSQDIWGHLKLKNSYRRLRKYFTRLRYERFGGRVNFLTYSVEAGKPRTRKRRLTRYGKFFLARRKLALFYGGIKRFKYKKYLRDCYKKSGSLNQNMLCLLESRLVSVVYRMNFARSMEEAKKMINTGEILVNKKLSLSTGRIIAVGDIVEVIDHEKSRRARIILSWMKQYGYAHKKVFLFLPYYFRVNYKIMTGVFCSAPKFMNYFFKLPKRIFSLDFLGKY